MYKVFKRKVYRREHGEYVPYHGRRITIKHVETADEARAICKHGPANQALEAGREYRNLCFYEYTS